MKVSRFNVMKEEIDCTYIYNTMTNSILSLNNKYAKQLNEALVNDSLDSIDVELKENLIKGEMIIDDEISELDYITMLNNISRFSNNSVSYTIAPTMKCNFRCPYCYEKGRNYGTMDEKIITDIKSIITNNSDYYKFLAISWYGGEPLLAFDIIEEISHKAIKKFGKRYSATMVTNGFLLTEEVAEKLTDLHIEHLQVTIDGPPDIHNERRCLPNKSDTFLVILNNIKKVLQANPKLNINIRVNTDKNNIDRVDEILTYLKEYNIDKKVGLYLAPIDNINDTCMDSNCFTNKEFAKKEMNFIKRHSNKGYNFAKLPTSNIGICGAVSSNSYIIDPYGDLYKCWDDIGNEKEKVGTLHEMDFKHKNKLKWLSYNFLQDDECKQCAFLPVCMGGCPNYQIKNNQKRCSPIKEHYNDLISVLAGLS